MKPAPRREVFGWAMYDFANSSYTTVIITVVYAVVFPRLLVGDGPEYRTGNLLWSVTLAVSYGLSAFALPMLGALMDRTGHRKRWLFGSTALTVGATAALFVAGPGDVALAMALVIASNVGFSIGESFIASFLPGLGPPESLGRISGMAWGLGYVGGLGCTAVILFGLGPIEADNWSNLAWVGPITALWFAVAAIPTFLLLRDRTEPRAGVAGQSVLTAGFQQLVETWRSLRELRDLMVFLLSYLFVMAGLSIVVSFAFIYGDQVIHWSAATQAAMFVITQLTATFGALAFGYLQSRIGDRATYAATLVVWIAAVGLIYATEAVAAGLQSAGLDLSTEQVFLLVGACAGLCIGATQSAGRTIVALYSPRDKTGEMFGLWGVAGKVAAIVGLLGLGLLQAQVGLQNGILVTAVFFGLGLVVVAFVDDGRARRVAREWAPRA